MHSELECINSHLMKIIRNLGNVPDKIIVTLPRFKKCSKKTVLSQFEKLGYARALLGGGNDIQEFNWQLKGVKDVALTDDLEREHQEWVDLVNQHKKEIHSLRGRC